MDNKPEIMEAVLKEAVDLVICENRAKRLCFLVLFFLVVLILGSEKRLYFYLEFLFCDESCGFGCRKTCLLKRFSRL